ncbi:MAG TPA: hypothetical protein VMC07_02295 [Candidatus Omnitrophota bacterium]|nr:hypothetical protein [Candidatus Omnitrophota bacterium]
MKKYLFKRGKDKEERCHCHRHCGSCGGVYFLGFIGALIFYLQAGEGLLGVLKALVWPVFIVMKLLGL